MLQQIKTTKDVAAFAKQIGNAVPPLMNNLYGVQVMPLSNTHTNSAKRISATIPNENKLAA